MQKQRIRHIILWLLLFSTHLGYGQFLSLKFEHITSENGLPHSTIHGITKDKYGFMWFGTWSGLCRYDGYRIRTYRSNPNDSTSLSNNRIHNILTDQQGNLWVLTFNEEVLARYNYASDNFDRIPQEDVPEEIANKIPRRPHKLTVNYTFQQHRWHLNDYTNAVIETYLPTGQSKAYAYDPLNPWSINDTYVSDIYLDDQQILWLGTYNHGINKADLNANPFHYLYHHPNNPNSIIEDNIRSICEDKEGNLWIATRSKGISVLQKNGQYRHFQHHPEDTFSLRSDYIKKIFCDSQGYIWIGTQKGVDRYNPIRQRIERMDIPILENIATYAFAEDKQNNIWIGSWEGLVKFDRKQRRFLPIDPAKTLPHKHIWCLLIDSRQQLWVGTEGGGIAVLKEVDGQHLQIRKHLGTTHQDSLLLSDNRVYSIFEDKQHTFWIGTGNGLDRYTKQAKAVVHLSQDSAGWPKGTIGGIIEDNQGYIWISHKQGISRIDKRHFNIRTFGRQDGLQSSELSEGAVYKSPRTQYLYFGGNRGLNYFSPDSIRMNRIPPKVVLTELRVLNTPIEVNQPFNGRVILHHPLYLSPSLHLIYEDKSISLEFAALHYVNPSRNKYAYMLVGFDQDWIYTDASKRVATYSNLASGEYTFKVKAANSDGVWSTVPTSIQIFVAPPFWASKGAYVGYVLLFLFLLYIFYYYITRFARLQSKLAYEALLHKKENELHENKIQFFTNISHEIKTPLTLILSPIQQLRARLGSDSPAQEQLLTMEKNGNRLLKTVNQLLDIRRFETGHEKMHMEQVDIIALAKKVVDSFAQEARQKRIRLKLASSTTAIYLSLDTDKIEKVLYNLLSNAFKFTYSGGFIKVRISQHPDGFVQLDVLDNGSGIRQEDLNRIFQPFLQGSTTAAGGTGLGLTYSKSLIEMHRGSISVQSRAQGSLKLTIFRVRLPLQAPQRGDTEPALKSADLSDQAIDNVSHASNHPTRVEDPPLPRKCTLLLVEDNAEMRGYLANFLCKDYHIYEAENGEIGLQLAREHVPDLIISDVMMPFVDGISFTRLVKADTLLRHIPIILLTARTLIEYEIEGLAIGADDYIVKPFHLQVLALKIHNLLLRFFQMQEKFKQKISMEPSAIQLESPDELLLQKVLSYVENHIAESDLKIDQICTSIGLSRAQLYRKMKALTGSSMADLIKEIRLKRAQQLLSDKKFQVNEVAYMVGFTDPDYFRKCFKAAYDISPSAYSKNHGSSPLS